MGRDGARAEWQDLSIDDLRGLTLIVGASDTGKSTFAHWLTAHLSERGRDVAHIDGDPGQSDLGPPATITLRQTHNEHWRWFVGATTPRGHTLPLVAGARRLADRARGADAIVYDTTGFVHSRGGGLHLKQALVDVLRPRTIVAIQAADELKPIVEPLRRRSDLRLRELPSAAGVCTKTRGERHAFRRHRFQHHFDNARTHRVFWPNKAVWPEARFSRHRLVGLCDASGFLQGLGIVDRVDRDRRLLHVRTALNQPDDVSEIRVGSLHIDPVTFEHDLR